MQDGIGGLTFAFENNFNTTPDGMRLDSSF